MRVAGIMINERLDDQKSLHNSVKPFYGKAFSANKRRICKQILNISFGASFFPGH